jgi:hypothetical protein
VGEDQPRSSGGDGYKLNRRVRPSTTVTCLVGKPPRGGAAARLFRFQPGNAHPGPSGTVRLSRIHPGQQRSRRLAHSGSFGLVRLGADQLGRTMAESGPLDLCCHRELEKQSRAARHARTVQLTCSGGGPLLSGRARHGPLLGGTRRARPGRPRLGSADAWQIKGGSAGFRDSCRLGRFDDVVLGLEGL